MQSNIANLCDSVLRYSLLILRSLIEWSVCLCDRRLKRSDSTWLNWQMYIVWIAQVQNKDDGKCHARYYTAVDTIQFTWIAGNRVCEWRRMSFPPACVRTTIKDERGSVKWNCLSIVVLKFRYEFCRYIIVETDGQYLFSSINFYTLIRLTFINYHAIRS